MNWSLILITFIGVNLDFFFILLFLLKKYELKKVMVGYIMGITLLVGLSFFAGQLLALFLPEWLLGILGILPIYMAFKDDPDDISNNQHHAPIMATFITYLSVCAGCNLSIFLPISTGLTLSQFLLVLLFLIGLSIVIVVIIKLIGNIPVVQTIMNRYGEMGTKIVYVAIGLYVFWDSGFLNHILAWI